MTIDNPVSENLNSTEPVTGGEAGGNCVAVRRGGKQPEAKEQSQIQVNSIRCSRMASLLATGEACAPHNLCLWHLPVNVVQRVLGYGWSGNVLKEVYVSGESCTGKRHRMDVSGAAVRAFIVVMKSGNSDGAKGGREDEMAETHSCHTIWNRLVFSDLEHQRQNHLRECGGRHLWVSPKGRACVALLAKQVRETHLRREVTIQLESRMRENRKSGSEGGVRFKPAFLPLSFRVRIRPLRCRPQTRPSGCLWRRGP